MDIPPQQICHSNLSTVAWSVTATLVGMPEARQWLDYYFVGELAGTRELFDYFGTTRWCLFVELIEQADVR